MLRPHLGWQAAYVRHSLPQRGVGLWDTCGNRGLRRERPINTFVFGPQVVQTKVQMMVPVGVEALEVDITAFMTSGQEAITPPMPLSGAQQNGKGARVSEVPAWKDNFPISWVDDHFVTRREFTKSLVWVSLATFLANVVLAMLGRLRRLWDAEALPQVQIATVHDLPVGGARVFTILPRSLPVGLDVDVTSPSDKSAHTWDVR